MALNTPSFLAIWKTQPSHLTITTSPSPDFLMDDEMEALAIQNLTMAFDGWEKEKLHTLINILYTDAPRSME